MGKKVNCCICGKDTEKLWKMERGLCDGCAGAGAQDLPDFDDCHEIVNLETGEVIWKKPVKEGKRGKQRTSGGVAE